MSKISRKFKDFHHNQSGVAALEFVLIFPILIMLFLGCVELYGHFHAVRKVGNVTASLADIVAQTASISTGQLDSLHPIATSLLAPLNPSSIRYRISSVRQGSAGQPPRLIWQHINGSKNGAGKIIIGGNEFEGAECGEFTGTEGKQFPLNQDSIFVVVEYTYTSVFSHYLGVTTEYKDTMIAIPRSSSTIRLTDKAACI